MIDALLLAEPPHVQRAHVRREEARPGRGPPLGGLQLFEENASFLFDGCKQVSHRSRCADQALAVAFAPAAGSPRAVFADATMFANPFGSSTAISARTLRFTSEPAFFRPAMSLL